MSGPYPLATLACTISPTGISAPAFADILASLQASYQAIYGSDVYLGNDSQDGQWLAVIATAINDTNSATIAAHQSFSPATAQGAGLSSVVKINGLQRETPSNSTAEILITGTPGTTITSGFVSDGTYQWALPTNVVIPVSGSITVTATCATQGAIAAPAGTLTQIVTPTRGWVSATNPTPATLGAPVESDAELRQRQSVSTSLPAETPLEAIVAAVSNIAGVQAVQPYENDGTSVDSNGVPAHSISLVVTGGLDAQVAAAIAAKKTPGCGTYGTTSVTVTDSAGATNTINFYRPTVERIIVDVTITPLAGWLTTTEANIAAALSAWVDALETGASGGVALNDLVAAAKLPAPLGSTYKIEYGALTQAIYGNTPGTADIALAFNQSASLAVSDVSFTVA